MKKNILLSLILGVFVLAPVNINANTSKETKKTNAKMSEKVVGISGEDAAHIAAKKAGVDISKVAYIELDYENGRKVYEGKIFDKGMEYEFEIDFLTGKILKWEIERMD